MWMLPLHALKVVDWLIERVNILNRKLTCKIQIATNSSLLMETGTLLLECTSKILSLRWLLLDVNNTWRIIVEASGRLAHKTLTHRLLNNDLTNDLLTRLWSRLDDLLHNNGLGSRTLLNRLRTLRYALELWFAALNPWWNRAIEYLRFWWLFAQHDFGRQFYVRCSEQELSKQKHLKKK